MSSEELSWFKSSYSDGEGGECLEAAYPWRKSSHSSGEGGDCLEVAPCPHTIHIRDSKNPTGPQLSVSDELRFSWVGLGCRPGSGGKEISAVPRAVSVV
ncbi:DUF397 domain-containing protein [Streptomyces sp. NL15-2K]|uniref:DUF397 domain-containing protein n=1 Tax=Streptomyces sp. NL15-2K TaxID=376149 RepID=UPI000F560BCA|nr:MULTISPECIES: DUF397 domain-containing protein [Actinomycetes]WKX11609.1 DUF397 domain-containing protein [Kutzneria buriramensis]